MAMVKIIYRDRDGTAHEVDAEPGMTLMEAAVKNGVVTIEGECGGACACATCHIYVPEEWQRLTGKASDDELEMLEFGVAPDERSRLGCQIKVTAEMEGLTVLTPSSQR
jgi:2Fe-2S ferredoxin